MAKRDRATQRIAIFSWGILLLLGAVSVLPIVPPTPRDTVDHQDFSVEQAFGHIRQLAQSPRPIGSVGNAQAREAIARKLKELGLDPQFQLIRVPDYYGLAGEFVDVVNVMARLPGSQSTGALLLMGHYDTVPTTSGANDDASALAVLLDIARVLAVAAPMRNDVILLFTDGEEPAPRHGSTAFLTGHPWASEVRFVVNLETIGSGGVAMIVEMSGGTCWISSLYAQSVPYPTAFSFVTTLTALIGGSNTDFATFRDAGIPGVDVAYLLGSPIYHTPADAPGTVSRRSLYQQGKNALAFARNVGSLDLAVERGGAEAVFFTIGRFVIVRYPAAWSIPLFAVAGVLIIAAVVRQRRILPTLLRSTLTIGVLVSAAGVVALLWIGVARVRAMMGITESYFYLGAFSAMTASFAAAAARLVRHRIEPDQDALGVIVVWWGAGLMVTWIAPGAGYLLGWPTLTGALLLLLRPISEKSAAFRVAGWAVLSGIALVLLIPAIDFFYQLAQPRPGNPDSGILPVIIIPIVLTALVFELLRSFRRGLASAFSQ